METHEMILAAAVVLLAGAALYLALTEKAPEVPDVIPDGPDTSAAEALLMKGLAFGKGATDYVYAYSEVSDGYENDWRIQRSGSQGVVHLDNPLSGKDVYFLDEDRVLCMEYGSEDRVCTSVANDSDMQNYVRSMEVKFFNDTVIQGNINDVVFLLDKGYLTLDPQIAPDSVDGRSCGRIHYTIDFSSITVSEAARFGIGASSPKIFDWTMCIDEGSGEMVERSFSYDYQGMMHETTYTLSEYSLGPSEIAAPENLTQGAVQTLSREKQQQIKLVGCFTGKEGQERDKCVSDIAISLRRKDLCLLADSRADQCLVSLVPVTEDEGICQMVEDPSYKQDCHIELAGAFKDASWCDEVADSEKKAYCLEVAMPPSGNETVSTEEGGSTVDIGKLLEAIDKG